MEKSHRAMRAIHGKRKETAVIDSQATLFGLLKFFRPTSNEGIWACWRSLNWQQEAFASRFTPYEPQGLQEW
jgi:hypothetical protein